VVFIYLGAAALAVPASPGSFGTAGGGGVIAIGIAFLVAAALEWRCNATGQSAHDAPM
jgi:hypothetical protein